MRYGSKLASVIFLSAVFAQSAFADSDVDEAAVNSAKTQTYESAAALNSASDAQAKQDEMYQKRIAELEARNRALENQQTTRYEGGVSETQSHRGHSLGGLVHAISGGAAAALGAAAANTTITPVYGYGNGYVNPYPYGYGNYYPSPLRAVVPNSINLNHRLGPINSNTVIRLF